ncbi:MAG: B12-binding domain-containing radical SAM protein [Bacteroidetes bacterium]|nr:B12-binding domain-containing radical SAM protein [Bacteroidota bacterium]
MKLLLTTLNSKYIHSNLAIRILYQLNKGYNGLDWKEFVIKEDQNEVAKYCSQYDVIAFSCYIWNITQTLAVARNIKSINPKIKILLGGPEVSYEWQDMIAKDEVDYIITGEGEIPFEEFLRDYPNLQNVSSLVRKENNEVYYNPNAPTFLLERLTDIQPYADDDVNTLANKVLYIETSRGCPYKCEFCLASLDNKVRYLPDVSIKRTLQFMMQYGKVIKFLDRTFNIKKDFTIGMFEYILANHRKGNVFQFEITADIVHPDIIAYIQAHIPPDLFRFEIGIQTVNQKANLEVSRKQNFDKTSAIIKQLDNKIEMHLDLIVGLPLDYYEDIKFSFEEVFKLFAPELQLGFLKFLKGTPVRDKYEQHEYKFDPMPPYQIIESKYLSKEQLNDIVILENALEIYWNRKRAFHTLKYVTAKYSIFDFLQGVGNLFIQKSNFFKHTLEEIYTILYEYAQTHFAADRILHQLIALDYYSYYKVKPKMLFLANYDKKLVQQQIESLQLNHHKYRYVAIDLDFNFNEFKNEGRIVLNPSKVWLQYDGDQQAEIIMPEMQMAN